MRRSIAAAASAVILLPRAASAEAPAAETPPVSEPAPSQEEEPAIQTSARLEVDVTDADNDCIDEARLAEAVEQRLARKVVTPDGAVLVRVSFEPHPPQGWIAHIELRGQSAELLGARDLVTRAPRCSELDSSLALVTALLVDSPAAAQVSRDVADDKARKQAPLVVPEPPPAPPGPKRAPPSEPVRFMPSVSALALLGHAPGLMYGARFGVAIKPPKFVYLGLDVSLYFPHDVEDDETTARGEVRHGAVGFSVCPWMTEGSPSLFVCVGQELGYTQLRASGFDVNQDPVTLDLLTYLRVGARIQLFDPVWLSVGLTGGVPLVRDRYIFTGPDQETHELFRTQPVIGIGHLGLAVELP